MYNMHTAHSVISLKCMETSATEHAERNLVEKMNTINTFGFILRLMLFALTQLQIGGQLFAEAGGDC